MEIISSLLFAVVLNFFRPDTLNQSVTDAARQVTWSLINRGDQFFLRADNQAPYFITYKKSYLNLTRIFRH